MGHHLPEHRRSLGTTPGLTAATLDPRPRAGPEWRAPQSRNPKVDTKHVGLAMLLEAWAWPGGPFRIKSDSVQ